MLLWVLHSVFAYPLTDIVDYNLIQVSSHRCCCLDKGKTWRCYYLQEEDSCTQPVFWLWYTLWWWSCNQPLCQLDGCAMVYVSIPFGYHAVWHGMTLSLAFILTIWLVSQLSRFSTVFSFGIEASVYPIGFGYQGFIYLLALSRFENLKISIPSSTSAQPSALDAQMEPPTCLLAPTTSTYTVIYTQESFVTVTQTTTYTTTAYLLSSTPLQHLLLMVEHRSVCSLLTRNVCIHLGKPNLYLLILNWRAYKWNCNFFQSSNLLSTTISTFTMSRKLVWYAFFAFARQ